MNILAIDTSGELCSTALLIGKEIIVREVHVPRSHADVILAMLDEILAEADIQPAALDAIAFGRGPGSFTGVRITAAVTQGVAYSLDKPVIPVSTLAALAQSVIDEVNADHVLTALDARMGEVYWAGYQKNVDGFAELCIAETVIPPLNIAVTNDRDWIAAGNGWEVYETALAPLRDTVVKAEHPGMLVRAGAIARLGEYHFRHQGGLSPELAIPVYLRNKVAEKKRS